MVANQIENRIILEICKTCPCHNHNQTDSSQICSLSENLCNPLVNADNALAFSLIVKLVKCTKKLKISLPKGEPKKKGG